MNKGKDAATVVVPFGKHKGATVAELFEKDPAYADWIMAQGWVAERFAELHAAIASRGAGNDDTPEHNALQARFLDEDFRAAFLTCVIPSALKESLLWAAIHPILHKAEKDKTIPWEVRDKLWKRGLLDALSSIGLSESDVPREKYRLFSSARFERAGVDVVLRWMHSDTRPDFFSRFVGTAELKIELKPSIGDDYPSVMRQMQRLGVKYVVAETYNGRGVSEPALKQMFEANEQILVFLRDIEAELPGVRAS
jgi:hypothetical protein